MADGYEWLLHAACRGRTSVMFPDGNVPEEIKAAKAICAECLVVDECYEDALACPPHVDDGIKAGTTRNQRKAMRAERKKVARIERRNAARCGSRSGANAHRKRGEAVCSECQWAEGRYFHTPRSERAS